MFCAYSGYFTCITANILPNIEKKQDLYYTMKVLPSGCADCVLVRKDVQTFGNQAGMSKQGDSPDCEYWRQLWDK